MFQTLDNCQLCIDSQHSSQQLTIVWSWIHHSTQPILIFSRIKVLHLDRLKEGTWLYSFACTVAIMALVGINIVGLPWETRTSGANTSWSNWRPRRGCCLPASCSSSTTMCLLKMPPASKMLSLTLATRSSGQLSMLPITSWEEFRSAIFQEKKEENAKKITFSNFSCRFLNPNNFFQFEL